MTAPTSIHAERRSRRAFRSPDVCAVAGITYRQLDFWTRTQLVAASSHPTSGHGDARWYRDSDVIDVCCVAALVKAGVALAMIRGNLGRILTDGRIETGPVAITIDIKAIEARVEQYRRAAS